MAKKINKKTGQIVNVKDDKTAKIAETTGATEDFKPVKQSFGISGNQAAGVPERNFDTREEFETAKRELGTSKDPRIIKEKETAKAGLEKAGAFEEVTPREVNLQAETGEGALGPSAGALGSASEMKDTFVVLKEAGFISDDSTRGEGDFPMPEDPLTLRELALRQIRQDSFDLGISQREKFGAAIEAIPALGGLVGRYVGGIVEAPYANQKAVLAEINKLKEAASTGQEKVRNGLEDPDYGLGRAREMEEDISKLEGRMKLLIDSSAILRANTDEVNVIQEQILEAREKVARYKQASSFGLTAQLTGTGRVIPTDEQMFMELKK